MPGAVNDVIGIKMKNCLSEPRNNQGASEVSKSSLEFTMSSRRLLTSVGLQVERATWNQSSRHAPPIPSFRLRPPLARLSLPAHRCLRRLSTTSRRQLQEGHPSKTTATTSSQDPNKAASAESTGATTTASPTTTTSTAAAAEPPTRSPKIYTYEDILALTTTSSSSSSPSPTTTGTTILIDVREPSELQATGSIPTAINIPITSSPDALFLPETEFEDRFGFPRPGPDDEVVFYCKSGVRSRAAARLAGQAQPPFGGRVGEFPGSWNEWERRREEGGKVEKGVKGD